MDFDEVVAKEKVRAKAYARLKFSPRFPFTRYPRKFYPSGKLFVTDGHICFRGKSKVLRYILAAVLSSAILLSIFIFRFLFSKGFSDNNRMIYIFNIVMFGLLLVSLLVPYILSFRWNRRLARGLVWARNKIEIYLSETELEITEGRKFTIFRLYDGAQEVVEALRSQPVKFEIPDLSKLDYHEKLVVLEERYKSGKISKELYDELKRRLPYT